MLWLESLAVWPGFARGGPCMHTAAVSLCSCQVSGQEVLRCSRAPSPGHRGCTAFHCGQFRQGQHGQRQHVLHQRLDYVP